MGFPIGLSKKNLAEVKCCREKPRGTLGCDNCTSIVSLVDMPRIESFDSIQFVGYWPIASSFVLRSSPYGLVFSV